jgi:hypothetical protein
MTIIVAFREDRNIRKYGDIPPRLNVWFALGKSFTFAPFFLEEETVNGVCY